MSGPGLYHPVSESKGAHLEKVRAIYSFSPFQLADIQLLLPYRFFISLSQRAIVL